MADLVSTEELEKLKKDILMLKKAQGMDDPAEEPLKASISDLSKSITSLLNVFKEASEELKQDSHDAVLISDKINRILERLDRMEAHNEKIAKGLVAVADMVEELQSTGASPVSRPVSPKPSFGPPSTPPTAQQESPKPLPQYNMPKKEEKKKSFLDNLNFKM